MPFLVGGEQSSQHSREGSARARGPRACAWSERPPQAHRPCSSKSHPCQEPQRGRRGCVRARGTPSHPEPLETAFPPPPRRAATSPLGCRVSPDLSCMRRSPGLRSCSTGLLPCQLSDEEEHAGPFPGQAPALPSPGLALCISLSTWAAQLQVSLGRAPHVLNSTKESASTQAQGPARRLPSSQGSGLGR